MKTQQTQKAQALRSVLFASELMAAAFSVETDLALEVSK